MIEAVRRWPVEAISKVGYGVKVWFLGVVHAGQWTAETARFFCALFLYTSRRFFRVEGYLAFAAVLLYFSILFLSFAPKGGHEILNAYYTIFTIGMILLGMNLLPRERDERTLEILWSQPFSRGGMVLVEITALTIWCGLLMALTYVLFGRFLSGEGFPLWVGIFALSTAFSVGLITVLISTFCRSAIATGVVAGLVFGVHYFWLRELAPPLRFGQVTLHLSLYFNPLPGPIGTGDVPLGDAIANRVFLVGLLCLVYDYLHLSLRRSSAWLT